MSAPAPARRPVALLASTSPHPSLLELARRLAATHDVVCATPETHALLAAVPHSTALPSDLETPYDLVVADVSSCHVGINALVRSAALRRIPVCLDPARYAELPGLASSAKDNARHVFTQTSMADAALARTFLSMQPANEAPDGLASAAPALQALFGEMFKDRKNVLHLDDAAAVQLMQRLAVDEDVEDEFGEWTVLVAVNGPLNVLVGPCDVLAASPYPLPEAARLAAAHAMKRGAAGVFDSLGRDCKTLLSVRLSRRLRVVAADQALLARGALASPDALVKFMCDPLSVGEREVFDQAWLPESAAGAPAARRGLRLGLMGSTPGGTSSQAVLDRFGAAGVVVCVSDKPDAGVLRRAKEAGVKSLVHVSPKGRSKQDYEARVVDELERHGVDLVVLVGYMRLLSPEFCDRFAKRILNVHPSLLPLHKGKMDLDVHREVLAMRESESGCSVHVVTAQVDAGPVVVQKRCAVLPDDSPEVLKARVQALEGPALIQAIEAFDPCSLAYREEARAQEKGDKGLTYAAAGVDVSRGDLLVELIKPACRATKRPGCVDDVGGFGAVFSLQGRFEDPILVSGTDGVGTKLLLAQQLKQVSQVGIDLVAMSVNDVLVQGAEPLIFLDYYASARLDVAEAVEVIRGIAHGCKESNCALVGGETAEMPDMYPPGAYDLAGFCMGAVERKDLLPKMEEMRAGDVLIGLRSDGFHSNGFSLVRKVLAALPADALAATPPFSSLQRTLGEALLTPTRLYVREVRRAIKTGAVLGLAHITGGGIEGNLPRVLPGHLRARVDLSKLSAGRGKDVWAWMRGFVAEEEMLETFNCGVGMVLVVRRERVRDVLAVLDEGDAVELGELDAEAAGVTFTGRMFPPEPAPRFVSMTYKQAGVDVEEGDGLVELIKPDVARTTVPGCLGGLGGFGALFDLKGVRGGLPDDFVLVSGTDGVGTKLLLGIHAQKLDKLGIDLVAMSVNDLLVQGAMPLYFLDYYACGKLNAKEAAVVVKGICEGCEQARCALVGGETAEMPGMYAPHDFDLAGFAVGMVSKSKLLPRRVQPGDVLVGLSSSGLHSNGFSLMRRVLAKFPEGAPGMEAVLEPTKIYVRQLEAALEQGLVEAMAHVTGSGMPGNLPRVLPGDVQAVVDLSSWKRDAGVWGYLRQHVASQEMLETFNCGVGMVLFVRPDNVGKVLAACASDVAFVMGKVVPYVGPAGDSQVAFEGEF